MKLAYDDNLGLPAELAAQLQCDAVPFHDVGAMIDAFERGEVEAMFAPCGALPYVRTQYDAIAQATFGPDRRQAMQSRFVLRRDAQGDAGVLTSGRIGCVNVYCTTSYWAPMIARAKALPDGTPIAFRQATGFFDMLRGVCDGRSDAAMVWDAVLEQHPDDAAQTREIFRTDGLPTPVVLGNPHLAAGDRARMTSVLSSYAAQSPWFFSGFTPADTQAVADFDRACRDVQARLHPSCRS